MPETSTQVEPIGFLSRIARSILEKVRLARKKEETEHRFLGFQIPTPEAAAQEKGTARPRGDTESGAGPTRASAVTRSKQRRPPQVDVPYMRQVGETKWYFRRRIPDDVRNHVRDFRLRNPPVHVHAADTVFSCSVDAASRDEARLLSKRLEAATTRVIARARKNLTDDAKVDYVQELVKLPPFQSDETLHDTNDNDQPSLPDLDSLPEFGLTDKQQDIPSYCRVHPSGAVSYCRHAPTGIRPLFREALRATNAAFSCSPGGHVSAPVGHVSDGVKKLQAAADEVTAQFDRAAEYAKRLLQEYRSAPPLPHVTYNQLGMPDTWRRDIPADMREFFPNHLRVKDIEVVVNRDTSLTPAAVVAHFPLAGASYWRDAKLVERLEQAFERELKLAEYRQALAHGGPSP